MATLTAQILVGYPHPYHDGINPTHYLFLSENSKPAWILVRQNIFQERKDDIGKITWIPTIENMLEDALLMIAIHICKDNEVIDLARNFCNKIELHYLELYSNFKEFQLKKLYEKCRRIKNYPKIIISIFRGSTIERQISVLENYEMDVEVCRPVYSRLYSPWTEGWKIEGSLR